MKKKSAWNPSARIWFKYFLGIVPVTWIGTIDRRLPRIDPFADLRHLVIKITPPYSVMYVRVLGGEIHINDPYTGALFEIYHYRETR